ncbi:hypothetical protein [Nonomuraea typhae]|uniref:Uncharacterized protein n=1 Tax=Nonomuraea typhae TaxID=2603600 RepID=A0ABW7YK37_9ACTN
MTDEAFGTPEENESMDESSQLQAGDVVFVFRLDEGPEGEWASPLLLQDAVLAVLRHVDLLPYGERQSPGRDAQTIAEFKSRATLQRPLVRRFGRSDLDG